MAFEVTPTSGEAPYLFTAIIDNASLIDGVLYTATVMYSTSPNSCPLEGNSTPWNAGQINDLINGNGTTVNTSVNPGICRTWTLNVFRVSDSTVVASSSVSVDNT